MGVQRPANGVECLHEIASRKRQALQYWNPISLEIQMSQTIRELDAAYLKGINLAAAITSEQLKYAIQIVQEVAPAHEGDTTLLAGVAQALATNYTIITNRT